MYNVWTVYESSVGSLPRSIPGWLSRKVACKAMAIPVVEFLREGYKIKKDFWLKINCSQVKLLNFANWCNGELSKSAKI